MKAALLLLWLAVPARADESPFLEEARQLAAAEGPRLVRLARATLEGAVVRGELQPAVVGPQHPAPFGVFVTLVSGKITRGCFGSMEPRGRSLEELVTEAAVGAARFDPRSRPVRAGELDHLQIILSIVGPMVPVLSVAEVDPKRMGLLVRSGSRGSVLLPGEARTARGSYDRNLRQASIRKGDPIEMFRFRTVTVYEHRR